MKIERTPWSLFLDSFVIPAPPPEFTITVSLQELKLMTKALDEGMRVEQVRKNYGINACAFWDIFKEALQDEGVDAHNLPNTIP